MHFITASEMIDAWRDHKEATGEDVPFKDFREQAMFKQGTGKGSRKSAASQDEKLFKNVANVPQRADEIIEGVDICSSAIGD